LKFRVFGIFLTVLSLDIFAGVWGAGPFENDGASDWVYGLESSKETGYLLDTIKAAYTSDYIEADTCFNVVAASEVVASLKDGRTKRLPRKLINWVSANKSHYEPEMSKFALKAVQICQNLTQSELAQLWAEDPNNEWISQLKSLEKRLK
jgi:hypothetical protein